MYKFWIATLLLGTIACSPDSNMPEGRLNEPEQIQFLTAVFSDESFTEKGVQATRGAITDNTTISNFGIYAYYTIGLFDALNSKPNFMLNTHVEKRNNRWEYNPVMYWPKEGYLSFFAYSPFGNSALETNTDLTTAGPPRYILTVPDQVSKHFDLLIARPLYNQTKNNINTAKRLAIPFRHALACIEFQAQTTKMVQIPIKVKSITIGSFKNKAQHLISNDAFNWKISPDAVDQIFTISTSAGLYNRDLSNGETQNLSTDEGRLMLIPQTTDQTDEITVETEYYMYGAQAAPLTRTKVSKLSGLIPNLEPGKKYTIKVLVTSTGEMTLTCSVAPWDKETVEVPKFE